MNIAATSTAFDLATSRGVETTFGEATGVYFVIRADGRAPTYRHETRHSANKEAIRLSAANPGSEFHVVKLKNTYFKAKAHMPTSREKVAMETEKQLAIRATLSIGQKVTIAASHYKVGGYHGTIHSFCKTSPQVLVYLPLLGEERHFAPSSLVPFVEDEKANEAPVPDATPVIKVGDNVIDENGVEAKVIEIRVDEGRAFIVHAGRFSRWIAIDQLRLPPSEPHADAYASNDAGPTLGELLEAAIKQAAQPSPNPERFERGTEVYVLLGNATLYGSFAMEATVYAYAGNGADMWVVVEGPDGPVKRIVKIEQVIARTDTRLKVIEL
jgi:hypothetical protein